MQNKPMGTFYGIGVGPGDPELMPVKAVNILKCVDMVYTAASSRNTYSLAVNIARPYIPETTPIVSLAFPMTRDRETARGAWQVHATTIHQSLASGKDVAFLTLGDSMTYSTYGYILQHIRRIDPAAPVVSVPGITSYQAAAACLNQPLVEGEESLLIVSGARGGDHLRRLAGQPANVVFLKAYRHVADITAALKEAGMLQSSVAVTQCGRPEQEIITDLGSLAERRPDYWTLILSHPEAGHDPIKK